MPLDKRDQIDSVSVSEMDIDTDSERAAAAPPRKKRLNELAAMTAVVLAATAVGIALWGQSPAKASAKPSSGSPASAALLAAKVVPINCAGSVPKLTVQGNGTATGTPDLLTLVAQVDVTDATAEASLADDNARTAAVVGALEADGVAAKDVQTTNLSIQPNYTWTDNTEKLTGYAVDDTISANFHAPFATAGKAIDDITGVAGNDLQIEALNFSFEDPRMVEDQARTDAVTQAVSHAESMAAAAGEQLGAVCSVTDDSAVQQYYPVGDDSAAGSPQTAARTPLQPGTQQETAQVTVVYALRPVS
jgi:uncharacterized protein YggE